MKTNQKIVIAIDAKEIAKPKIGSLGFILLELIPRLKEYELLLLSDVAIPKYFIPSNAKAVIRNISYTGGSDLVKYQYWIKRQCAKNNVSYYFQINHFVLFKMKGVKQIAVVHDLYSLEKFEKKTIWTKATYWISIFLTIINSETIFTVSEFSKKRLEHFFWKSKKVKVNYNGITVAQTSDKSNVVDGKFMLMLGRVSYWKGTLRIAKFFEEYFKDSEYKLIIAGQAHTEEDSIELKRIISRVNNIIWLDYVDNETRDWLLQNAELFLYASRYDGFGLPPLEAAMARTKVLMNDIPVLREVTQNQGNYVDFYSNDTALYEAIYSTVRNNDSEQIERMYKVAKSYTWDSYTNKIKKEFNSIRKE